MRKKGEGSLDERNLKVEKLIVHPDYHWDDHPTLYNDVSILYLAQEVDLSTYTPACLPKANDFTAYNGKMALAVGKFIILELHGSIKTQREAGNAPSWEL